MIRRCVMLLLLAVNAAAAQTRDVPVQTPVITQDTPVNTAMLQAWLHGGDPPLVAWAATFAQRTHDRSVLGEIPAVLEAWRWPSSHSYGEPAEQPRRAGLAMVDALLVENTPVPISMVDSVADAMPAQALILAERMPLRDSQGMLQRWAMGRRSGWGAQELERVSTMLLAREPLAARDMWGGTIVAQVVAAAEESLKVVVAAQGTDYGEGSSSSCGDSMARPVTPGWPEVYAYELEEETAAGRGTTLVELGGDRIAWSRSKENGGGGSCQGVAALDGVTRHRLLAYWLGVPVAGMEWQPHTTHVLPWSNESTYEKELGAAVAAERTKLRGTVEALRRKNLLTQDESERLLPALKVTVVCDITPCPLR